MPADAYQIQRARQEADRQLQKTLERQRAEREAREREEAEEQAERVRQDAAARAEYLKGLADKETARKAEREAELDRELEPAKVAAKVKFLAENYNTTDADFERHWPNLREALLVERHEAVMEATRAEARRNASKYF